MSDLQFLDALTARAAEGVQSGSGSFGLGATAQGTLPAVGLAMNKAGLAWYLFGDFRSRALGERHLFGYPTAAQSASCLEDFVTFSEQAGERLAHNLPSWGVVAAGNFLDFMGEDGQIVPHPRRASAGLLWTMALFCWAPERERWYQFRPGSELVLIPDPWGASLAALEQWRCSLESDGQTLGTLAVEAPWGVLGFPYTEERTTDDGGICVSGTWPLDRLGELRRLRLAINHARKASTRSTTEPRIRTDPDTSRVYLDGDPHKINDRQAFCIFAALVELHNEGQTPVTREQVTDRARLSNCTRPERCLEKHLPAVLRSLWKSKSGRSGRWWLELPRCPR